MLNDASEPNFASNGYCRACERARKNPDAAGGVSPAMAMRIEQQTKALLGAKITPFPELPKLVRCSCCSAAPTKQVGKLPFCDRCAYYVSVSGRCAGHSFREFIPELLGNPDPPKLPPMQPLSEVRHYTGPDVDETDVGADHSAQRAG